MAFYTYTSGYWLIMIVFEFPKQGRFMFAGDCAMNITPGIAEKVEIIKNSAELARKFGIEVPKVACLSALEKVNPKMQSSVDAAELAAMDWHGECEGKVPLHWITRWTLRRRSIKALPAALQAARMFSLWQALIWAMCSIKQSTFLPMQKWQAPFAERSIR